VESDLTGAQGAVIEALLLPGRTPQRGGRRRDRRAVIAAMARAVDCPAALPIMRTERPPPAQGTAVSTQWICRAGEGSDEMI
jgi:hypothetical protein